MASYGEYGDISGFYAWCNIFLTVKNYKIKRYK